MGKTSLVSQEAIVICGTENKSPIIANAVCATMGSYTCTHVAMETQKEGHPALPWGLLREFRSGEPSKMRGQGSGKRSRY